MTKYCLHATIHDKDAILDDDDTIIQYVLLYAPLLHIQYHLLASSFKNRSRLPLPLISINGNHRHAP
jgi:hypothetical protein